MDIFAKALQRLDAQQKQAAVAAEELQGGGAPPMDPAMGGAPPMDPAMGGAPMDPAMGGAPMDPAMMDPAMMDPAMAGGMPPEEDPLVMLMETLEDIRKQTKQANVMMAAIIDALNVQIPTSDLLEMEESPLDKASAEVVAKLEKQAAADMYANGRPGMPSSAALAKSSSAALNQMCRVAARHLRSAS